MNEAPKEISRKAALNMANDLDEDFDESFRYVTTFIGENSNEGLPSIRFKEGIATSTKPSNILYRVKNATILGFIEGVERFLRTELVQKASDLITEDDYKLKLKLILAGLYVAKEISNLSTVKLSMEDSAVVFILYGSANKDCSGLDHEQILKSWTQMGKATPNYFPETDVDELRKSLSRLEKLKVVACKDSKWHLLEKVMSE